MGGGANLDDVGYPAAAREPTACVLAVAGSLGGHVRDGAGAVYRWCGVGLFLLALEWHPLACMESFGKGHAAVI